MAALVVDQNIVNATGDSTDNSSTVITPVDVDDPVILRCNQTLKLETAIEILGNTDQHKVINKVPENPKGGDTFLLIPHPGDEEAWKNDGYRWCHYGPKLVPGKCPTVQKRYYAAYMSNGKVSKFHKNVYQLINDDRERVPVVVHYFGDHTIAATRDAKQKDYKGFDNSVGGVSSEHRYSKYDGERKFTVHRASKPKQIKKCILSKDDFQELHRTAYGLDCYVKLISHYPDLVIVFAMKEISDDLENLLKLNQELRPLFSYSNSYELGEYIVSTFLYTHPAFLERPTIPSHFVIHEKACGLAHQELCKILAQMVPNLAGSSNPIVLNLDPNKFSAVSTVFPNMHTLFSWKDVIANTKAWLYANGANQQEVTVYIEDLRQLFSRRSKELYEEALAECKTRWHGFFEEYYMKEIHEVVNDRLGRWALEKWNVYNPYTGVTDKSNEGMEIVIRQLKISGNAPVHSTVLALCLLQRWLYGEIYKSYCGVGQYTIRAEFQPLQRTVEEINTNATPCPPDQILFYIQNKRTLVAEGILKEDCANSEIKLNLQSSASQLVKAGAIAMNSKQQSFTVKVNPVTYYEVKLFPKVSCTCEDVRNGLCSHVLAVKISLGINIEEDLRKYQPHRAIKTELKTTIRKLKREGSVENIQSMQSQVKRCITTDEELSMQSGEMIQTTTDNDEATQESETGEVDQANAATALLQTTIDENQLQLMQIAASSFRQEVGLNM
ncbi:uncharacterized protein LOC130654889 [Hydractinia symbiolongicarpus]|uniref:uncharacterized protein LOC130654889 n=1 Tax=Hydractinia symbiolongicarpus TaxID=13093 RepID=UPI00254C0012|nr:uncharacterized protein LOC130654889 [Hydractinia symbiolongicarpus]